MALGDFLHKVVGGLKNTERKAVNTVRSAAQLPQNIVNNVAHPQNIVNNASNIAQQAVHPAVAQLNSLYHSIQPHHPAIGGGIPSDPNNPLSIGRVQGTLDVAHAADNQGYSDFFKNIVQGAKPYVGQGGSALTNPSAGGEYNPRTNQISLRSDQVDPYTITHEGLHAAYQRKTPLAQAEYQQLAQSGLDPDARDNIDGELATSLYGNTQGLGNIASLPQHLATEVHSYAPQDGSVNSRQLNDYYKRYFSDSNFYEEPSAKVKINKITGINKASRVLRKSK